MRLFLSLLLMFVVSASAPSLADIAASSPSPQPVNYATPPPTPAPGSNRGTFYWNWIADTGANLCKTSVQGRNDPGHLVLGVVEILPKPNAFRFHCVDRVTGAEFIYPLSINSEPYPFVHVYPKPVTSTNNPEVPAVAEDLCRSIDVHFGISSVDRRANDLFELHCNRRTKSDIPYDDAFGTFVMQVEYKSKN
jgi:hypothetical protein